MAAAGFLEMVIKLQLRYGRTLFPQIYLSYCPEYKFIKSF